MNDWEKGTTFAEMDRRCKCGHLFVEHGSDGLGNLTRCLGRKTLEATSLRDLDQPTTVPCSCLRYEAETLDVHGVRVDIPASVSLPVDAGEPVNAITGPKGTVAIYKGSLEDLINLLLQGTTIELQNGHDPVTLKDFKVSLPPISFTDEMFARKPEAVDHPSHYGGADDPFEHIKVCEAKGWGYHIGNCTKYLWRLGLKTPDALEDAKKARWYLDRYIQNLERET